MLRVFHVKQGFICGIFPKQFHAQMFHVEHEYSNGIIS